MLIPCDGPLPEGFIPSAVVGRWLISDNGSHHLNSHKKKIPSQIVDITKMYLPEEL